MIIWPAQCDCGHIFQERYEFTKPNALGFIGFCWCGWCRTKRWVKECIELKDTRLNQDRGQLHAGIRVEEYMP